MMQIPKKITVKVTKTYWACNIESHRHKTKEVAARCMSLHSGRPRQNRWSRLNLYTLLAQRLNGLTFKEIGEFWDISPNRARQVFLKADRVDRHEKERTARLEHATQKAITEFFDLGAKVATDKGSTDASV